jgi:hypothetical protein
MIKLSIKARILAGVAEISKRISDWSTKAAFSHLYSRLHRNYQYGSAAKLELAEALEAEAMAHEPGSLCRTFGLSEAKYYTDAADRQKKWECKLR